MSYEKRHEYFSRRKDALAMMWYQQISQAFEMFKPEYKVTIDEIAVNSYQKYAAYQEVYFLRLGQQNHADSKKVNGWWHAY